MTRLVLLCMLAVPFLARDRCALAAKPPAEQPIFVASFSSFDSFLKLSDTTLKLADRADLSLAMRGAIAISTGGLKGIDRKRPFGLLTYIDKRDLPDPVAVYFVPISNEKDFTGLLKANAAAKPVKQGSLSLWKIRLAGGDWVLRYVDGYAVIAARARSLVRDINPKKIVSRLPGNDLTLRFNIASVPTGMKTMLLDYIRAAAANRSDRAIGETRDDHRHRRIVTQTSLDALARITSDARSLTFGLKSAGKTATISATVVPEPKSQLAARMLKWSTAKTLPLVVPTGQPFLHVNVIPDTAWQPLARVMLADLFRSGRKRDPARIAAVELAGLVWKGGLRFLLWQPKSTKRVVGKAVITHQSAAGIHKLIKELKAGGKIDSLNVELDDKLRVAWYHITWQPNAKSPKRKATIAVNTNAAWLAVGEGDLKASLAERIRDDRLKLKTRKPDAPATLLAGAIRLSALLGVAAGETKDRIRFTATTTKASLTISTTLDAAVLASFLKPFVARTTRRIPALRK